jgi:hypothetical protein
MAVVGMVAMVGQTFHTGAASATPPPFVTILFSRSQWAVGGGCTPLPGAMTLQQVAADLYDRGGIGAGSVVTSWLRESTTRCTRSVIYPSWDTLESLHTDYGWESVSHSATHRNMTTLTHSQQEAESCGTLPTFVNHGFTRAWGMFAYPNNKRSVAIQTDVVSTCFAFGRRYSPSANRIGTTSAPWWGKVKPVNGGRCNDPTAACSSIAVRYLYENPFTIASLVQVTGGQWAVVQFHKLVSGSRSSGTVQWDCRDSDWRLHFTSRTEMYCWNDYQRVLNAIPTGAVVTDPARVAQAWGSNPDVLAKH